MDPITIQAVGQTIGQSAQEQATQQATQLGGPGQANADDQLRFQAVMQPEASGQVVEVQGLGEVEGVSAVGAPEEVAMGDVILDGLQKIKNTHESGMARVQSIMGQDQIATKDMLQLQFELTSMNIELETASKVADKSSQGIQSMMRNQ